MAHGTKGHMNKRVDTIGVELSNSHNLVMRTDIEESDLIATQKNFSRNNFTVPVISPKN